MKVLFHIGLAKAGSTYLQRWFAAHPDIVQMQDLFPIVKKGKWVLENPPRLTVLSDERFSSWIKHEVRWDRRFDPDHDLQAYRTRTRDYLFALNPDADILIVTRAPSRELLRSIYSQYVKTGGTQDFRGFFDMAMERIRIAFDYEAVLALYEEKFPRERILILPLEMMRDDLEAFLGVLESRFDLDRYRLPPKTVNPSIGEEEMFFYPRLNGVVTRVFRVLLGGRGYRLLMLYIKLLSGRYLSPLAKVYARLHSKAFASQFDGADEYVRQLRGDTHRVLESPHFEPYRDKYAA